MPSATGFLELDKELDGKPKVFYITLAHMPCQTKRTWKLPETFRSFIAGDADGFFITSRCPECDSGLLIQIFKAKDLPEGWSYDMPLLKHTEVVQDDSELRKEV